MELAWLVRQDVHILYAHHTHMMELTAVSLFDQESRILHHSLKSFQTLHEEHVPLTR